jgi:hypothetical protein
LPSARVKEPLLFNEKASALVRPGLQENGTFLAPKITNRNCAQVYALPSPIEARRATLYATALTSALAISEDIKEAYHGRLKRALTPADSHPLIMNGAIADVEFIKSAAIRQETHHGAALYPQEIPGCMMPFNSYTKTPARIENTMLNLLKPIYLDETTELEFYLDEQGYKMQRDREVTTELEERAQVFAISNVTNICKGKTKAEAEKEVREFRDAQLRQVAALEQDLATKHRILAKAQDDKQKETISIAGVAGRRTANERRIEQTAFAIGRLNTHIRFLKEGLKEFEKHIKTEQAKLPRKAPKPVKNIDPFSEI